MKISSNSEFRIPNSERAIRGSQSLIRDSARGPGASKRNRGEDGMATFILIALLAIMVALVMAESTALFHLHRELQLLEQHQIQRLDASQTNSVAASRPDSR